MCEVWLPIRISSASSTSGGVAEGSLLEAFRVHGNCHGESLAEVGEVGVPGGEGSEFRELTQAEDGGNFGRCSPAPAAGPWSLGAG